MEKISVIVPIYNIAQYIRETVLSIRNQTYRNLEIILVDDGSTDGSSELLSTIAEEDSRIHVLHKENGGVTSARLAGIQEASGEWIGFVDGDDYIEPEMYERLLENAHVYEADISHCGYQMIFPSRTDYYYNTGKIVNQNKQSGLKDLLEGQFIEPSLCNKLFKREIFQALLNDLIIDSTIRHYEDLLLNYYLFKNSERSVYEDICPYHYMVRKDSAATGVVNDNKLRDPLKVFRIITADVRGNDQLYIIITGRYVHYLIRLSTMLVKDNSPAYVWKYKKKARKQLRQLLNVIFLGKYSRKLKIQAFWTAVWPWSYEVIHHFYGLISGVTHRFDVT